MSDKSTKTGSASKKTSLMDLFSKYFWLGIVLILLSIILDLQWKERHFALTVVIDLMEAIGVAIVVAAIFTYVSGTSEFMDKITTLLQSIVIGRKFLGDMDEKNKKIALSSLIKPSSEEKEIYSNIEGYLNTYIAQTMDVTRKCVRSNYNVSSRGYIENGNVFVNSKITYRLYPTKDGFDAIKVGFLEHEDKSKCVRVVVSTPKGEREVHDESKLKFESIQIDAGKARLAKIDLSKYANETHLDIYLELIEAGMDRWMMLSFCTLMPTDGFRHMISCENGLKINAYHTFVHGAKIHVEKRSELEMETSCTEWINEGTGLAILIALPHEPNAE